MSSFPSTFESHPGKKVFWNGQKRLALVFLLALCFGIPASIDLSIERDYELRTLHAGNYRSLKPATVAIVPGASVYKNAPSPVLKDRLDCALELYRQGKVRKILLSGDNGSRYYNEVKPMLTYVLERNVNQRDVFVDHAGFRTLDTLVRAKEIFQVKDAIFVSQKFHQPRAAFIAKKSVWNSNPTNRTDGPMSAVPLAVLENSLRELLRGSI